MIDDRVVAVTGAGGFVGAHVCGALSEAGWRVRAIVRHETSAPKTASETRSGIDLSIQSDWKGHLEGVEVLVHCAGLAHTNFDTAEAAHLAFDRINRGAAIELAQAAIESGVHRFVFMSSIGVYGALERGIAATESAECRPVEPYALSKLAAERELQALCEFNSMELVVLRPPLVYGPVCPGNFSKLVRLVRTGLPLPFGRIPGRRHFVSVTNLSDLVVAICAHGEDASGVFNVADAEEIGLEDIVQAIADGLGRPARVIDVSPRLLRGILKVVGQESVLDKLAESVMVDASRARVVFDWRPHVSSEGGMRAAASSFLAGVPS